MKIEQLYAGMTRAEVNHKLIVHEGRMLGHVKAYHDLDISPQHRSFNLDNAAKHAAVATALRNILKEDEDAQSLG